MPQLLPELLLFNYANCFNPKFFDASYLRINLNPHILALKVLKDVGLIFFYLNPVIAWNVGYSSAGCVPCVCFLAIVLFFFLEFFIKHWLVNYYVQVLY